MKFNTAFSVAALALGVIAEPVIVGRGTPVERDVPAITNVLNVVGAGLTALDTAVNAFSGDPTDLDNSAVALVTAINEQAASVPASGALTVGDAIALAGPVQALQGVGQKLVTDLIAQKSAFEAAGLCGELATITTQIQTASGGLIDAIVALVPGSVTSVAIQLAAPFVAALADGVAAFAPGSCVDVVGPTSSAPPTSSSTASATDTSSSSVADTSSSSSASVSASATGTTSSSSASTSSSASVGASASGSASSSASVKPTSASSVSKHPGATGVSTHPHPGATGGSSSPSSVHNPAPYPTVTKPGLTVSATGVAVTPKASQTVPFTGAADMNRVANSFGVVALAAALLIL